MELQSPIDDGKMRAIWSQLIRLCGPENRAWTIKFPDWYLRDFQLNHPTSVSDKLRQYIAILCRIYSHVALMID